MINIKDVADEADVIMHVHASDRKLTEAGSAKFFVKENEVIAYEI